MLFDVSEEKAELKGISETEQHLEKVSQEETTADSAEKEFKEKKSEAESSVEKQLSDNYAKLEKRGGITLQEMDEFARSLPKKDYIPDERYSKIYEPIEEFDPRVKADELKLDEFANELPEDPSYILKDVDITPTYSANPEKRSLIFENELTPCGRIKKSLVHYEEISNVLLDTTRNILQHQQMAEQSKRDDIQRLKHFKNEIETLDQRYNMTAEDYADAWFLYDRAAKAQKSLEKRSDILLAYHKKSALPIVRRQLNFVLESETGHGLNKFFEIVHSHAMEGFKRSTIPGSNEDAIAKRLHRIKRELKSMIHTKDDMLPDDAYQKIVKIRSEIEHAKETNKLCQNY